MIATVQQARWAITGASCLSRLLSPAVGRYSEVLHIRRTISDTRPSNHFGSHGTAIIPADGPWRKHEGWKWYDILGEISMLALVGGTRLRPRRPGQPGLGHLLTRKVWEVGETMALDP